MPNRDEVRTVLNQLVGGPHLMGLPQYGAALRLLECAPAPFKNCSGTAT